MLESWFKRYKYDNTRRYLRLPAAWPIKIELAEPPGGRQVSSTQDVSAGGVAVRFRNPLPAGSRVRVEVSLVPLGRSISAGAQVVRCSPGAGGEFDLGIRFDQITPEDRKALEEAVERFSSPRDRAHQKKASWRRLP